jgi:hypothetical protein
VSTVAPTLVKVRVDWSEVENARAYHVTQAIGQVGPPGSDGMPDGIYVTLGTIAPPALLDGDAEAVSQALERLTSRGAKVNVVSQVHMSRQMLNDFIGVLQATAAKYDAAVDQGPVKEQEGGPA